MCSIRLRWVWVCGPASRAVNDGVSEACSGTLEQHKSHWAKSWGREGPAPLFLTLSLSMLPRKSRGFNSSAQIPAGKCFRWGGGRGMKPSVQGLHELRWENQASLTPSGITVEDHVNFQKAGPELQWSFHLGFIQSQRASSSFMRWCN